MPPRTEDLRPQILEDTSARKRGHEEPKAQRDVRSTFNRIAIALPSSRNDRNALHHESKTIAIAVDIINIFSI